MYCIEACFILLIVLRRGKHLPATVARRGECNFYRSENLQEFAMELSKWNQAGPSIAATPYKQTAVPDHLVKTNVERTIVCNQRRQTQCQQLILIA